MSDAALIDYFLNSEAKVVQLELLRISHSAFTQTFNLVRNHPDGVTITMGGGDVFFQYMPMRIQRGGEANDLAQSIRVDLGDLGEVWPDQLDAIRAADAFGEKPKVTYWTYRSDDLSAPLRGPIDLEVTDFSFNRQGASFEAKAPRLNVLSTGMTYLVSLFPTLRGVL